MRTARASNPFYTYLVEYMHREADIEAGWLSVSSHLLLRDGAKYIGCTGPDRYTVSTPLSLLRQVSLQVCSLPVSRGIRSAPSQGIPLDDPAAALVVEPWLRQGNLLWLDVLR